MSEVENTVEVTKKKRKEAKEYFDMFANHPVQTATQMVFTVYVKLWVETGKSSLPIKIEGEEKGYTTKSNNHELWSREVFYDRLVEYNNKEWETYKDHEDVKSAIASIMKRRSEKGITEVINFKINSTGELRKSDLHGGAPRFAQLFSYSRDQLSKHAGYDKKALRTKLYLPPIKIAAQKPEVDFKDLYETLLKG